MKRHEFHISNFPVGHIMFGSDCWCEPSGIYITNHPQYGECLVVEHKDDCPFHHKMILAERNLKQDWITKALNEVPIGSAPNSKQR